MRTAPSISLLVLLVGPLACGGLTDRPTLPPDGQVLVYINTDATLPPGPGESLRDDEQAPFFHRLVVELFPPDATTPCEGCSREFALDRREVAAGRASFGFVPRKGVAGYRARFALYRTAGPGAQFPRKRSTIELVALLPVAPNEGIAEATAILRTDDVGVPRGTLEEPEVLELGRAKPGLVGTWGASLPRECGGDVDDTEVCVPGGAYWTGNPVRDPESERLVKVSPFAIGLSEVTVRQYRAAKVAAPNVPANPIPTDEFNTFCTYTPAPGRTDDYPVNCVDALYAEKYCAAVGHKRLPTETEFEIVSGALRGLRYPWGETYPTCEDATWGRADDQSLPATLRPCSKEAVGAAKVGRGTRDRIRIGDKEVVDMAGNVGEWTADDFAAWGASCWKSTGIASDPLCHVGGSNASRSIRGGEWGSIPFSLVSTIRIGAAPTERSTRTGFRCAH